MPGRIDGVMSWIRTFLDRIKPNPSVGARGERVAARHLRRLGYRILARNLRTRGGEIDLLAQAPDRRTVVVVEVKSATARDPGEAPDPRPEEHVNYYKQRRLTALACQIARRYHLEDRPIRFDVIGVEFACGAAPIVRHHPGAFESRV